MTLMTAEPAESSSNTAQNHNPLAVPEGAAYRNQKKRYPWWVKSVDSPTIIFDLERMDRPDMKKSTAIYSRHSQREDYEEFIKNFPNIGLKYNLDADKMTDLWRAKWQKTKATTDNNEPGHSLRDWALFYAAYGAYLGFNFDLEELSEKTQYTNLVERLGAKPWQGSKLEASRMIESAGMALGASQIGFAEVHPMILYDGVELPPEMKYVIAILHSGSGHFF